MPMKAFMKAFDEDLKKYWYVRPSTLNKFNSIEFLKNEIRIAQKEYKKKEKQEEKENERMKKATIKRNSDYVKHVFEKHYWNVDRCMICWSKWILHIHHKDKNRRNNEYTNLIKICVRCHIKAHQWEKAWEILQKFYNKKINQK